MTRNELVIRLEEKSLNELENFPNNKVPVESEKEDEKDKEESRCNGITFIGPSPPSFL